MKCEISFTRTPNSFFTYTVVAKEVLNPEKDLVVLFGCVNVLNNRLQKVIEKRQEIKELKAKMRKGKEKKAKKKMNTTNSSIE